MDYKLKKVVNATLALMMTSTSVYAGTAPVKPVQGRGNVILAQADCDPAADPNCAVAAPEAPVEEPQRREQPAEEAAPRPEAEPAPRQAAPEAPAAEEAPAPRRQRLQAEPETPAVQEAPAAEEPAAEPAPRRQRREKPAAEPVAPAVEQPSAPSAEEPARPRREKPEQPRQEQQPEPPAAEQPTTEQPTEQPNTEQPASQPEAPEKPARAPRREKPNQPAAPAPAEQPSGQPSQEAPVETPAQPNAEQPNGAQPVEQPQPADGQDPPAPTGEQPAPVEAAPNDGANAPLFDSQKRPPRRQGQNPEPAEDGQPVAQPPAEPAAPPPADDRAAQEAAQPTEIVPVTQERGTRREGRPDRPRRERPQGADVVRELGDRLIIQFNNQTFVESNEAPRMSRGARDVYYEDLPRGRTRETIVRENGVQVVTIRNQYGDVVRRSRITPDGREYVLTYVEDEDFERGGRAWRDPGDDLPPMNVDIDYDDYVFEAEGARDVDDYYNFLREPPVERVKRLYSVDEVKRSARVRDIARRIDLDTIKFGFGKAEVPESEITRLEGVAQAMERLLKANPAETFLIEGHTDAVGTEIANLALSDRRAEAVADALTNVFGIPPENLSTQGYGEQFLKVRTQEPNQENRRVAIRRITALVAPMASAK